NLGDRLWGEYGFYDAFHPEENWVAGSYLAIDQGPIVCMIENYRTGLLWDLFMSAPEIQQGLDKLQFEY
ncbi:MAG: glucoamylase family protein, partial [Saprospiraceae bacterium]|nr:glucoamylase family protein [Saprospiraceae bacterium]